MTRLLENAFAKLWRRFWTEIRSSRFYK
jgi:hypothetical protein